MCAIWPAPPITAFISGLIASVPGVAALMSAPRLGKLGDRIGPERILICMLIVSVLLLIPMAFVQTPWQLGVLRFLLGAADGALLPAVQTLLIYNCTNQVAGRIFSYNQSFRDVGNVSGPLLGAAVSAGYGFRAVFGVTALVVLFNAGYSGGVCGGGRATCGKTRCRKNNSCIYRQFPPLAGSTPRFPTFNNASFGPANFRPTRNILTSTSCLSTIN